jgi:hypothetical protein
VGKKFLKIPLWRWLLLFFLFIGISFNSYDYYKFYTHSQPGLFNLVLEHTNNIKELCFLLPFAWLLIIGDINILTEPKSITNKLNCLLRALSNILLINFVLIISLLLIDTISLLINTGTLSLWSGNPVFNGFPTVLVSILFLFFRFVFFSLVICLLNMNLKNPLGIIGVIIINLLDWKFYSIFNLMKPLGILPIEHTRIYYTEALAPMVAGDSRFSFALSFAYWGIIIIILLAMIFLSLKRLITKIDNNESLIKTKSTFSVLNPRLYFSNKGYITGIAILIISTFVFLKSNLRFDIFKDLSILGANNLFVFCTVSNSFIEVLVPIIPSLIIIGGTNIIDNTIIEKYKNHTGFLKYLYIIIAGGSVFIISSIIIFVVFLIISPSIKESTNDVIGLFSHFYNSSNLLYIILYLAHSFVFGGVFALFCYSIYNFSKNKFYTIILPLLFYRASTYVPIIQNSNINAYLSIVIPLFPYEIIGFEDSVWVNTWQLALILLASLLILSIKDKNAKEKIQ